MCVPWVCTHMPHTHTRSLRRIRLNERVPFNAATMRIEVKFRPSIQFCISDCTYLIRQVIDPRSFIVVAAVPQIFAKIPIHYLWTMVGWLVLEQAHGQTHTHTHIPLRRRLRCRRGSKSRRNHFQITGLIMIVALLCSHWIRCAFP